MHEKTVATRIIHSHGTLGGEGILLQLVIITIIAGKHVLIHRIIHLHIIERFAIAGFTVIEKAVSGQSLAIIGHY